MNDRLPPVGIDSFSYHRRFGDVGSWESPSSVRWSTGDFLDRANELGVSSVSLQTLYLGAMEPAAMRRLRSELDERGLTAVLAWGHRCGLDSGRNPVRVEQAMACLDAAAAVGARLMRIVCGDQFAFSSAAGERIRRLAPLVDRVARRAADLGIGLAIENHADFVMADLVELVETIAAPNLGICLDLGNALRVGDDPVAAARLAASHVTMVHVKDMIVPTDSRGRPWARWPTVPVGEGEIAVPEALGALAHAGIAPTLFVEMALMHPDHPDEDAAVAHSVAYLLDRSLASGI